jgi:hypothetical protein
MADEQNLGSGEQGSEWKDKHDALQAQYTKDMELVYNVLNTNKSQPEVDPGWDVSDGQTLKKQIEESLKKTVVDTLVPVMTTFAGNQFESHVHNAKKDERMPHFTKWENEIRTLLKGVAPGMLANYDTLLNVYSLVASRHQSELIEEEVTKRVAAAKSQDDDVEIEDEEAESIPEVKMPVGQGAVGRTVVSSQTSRSVRSASPTRLTREQVRMAELMGMTPRQYAQGLSIEDVEI